MLEDWANKWGIPREALKDLVAQLDTGPGDHEDMSEAAVQTNIQLAACGAGWRLWRNNVGAFKDPESRRWVRYGLCNVSKAMNGMFKSSDLIGIKPVLITAEMVGTTIGQFVAVEVKEAGWRPGKDKREKAQAAFMAIVTGLGGLAGFSTGRLP